MDHSQFKANQTAAVYVADGLDERTLEAFEMHMMGCTECIEDVESWRAIKVNMPTRARPARAPAVLGRNLTRSWPGRNWSLDVAIQELATQRQAGAWPLPSWWAEY